MQIGRGNRFATIFILFLAIFGDGTLLMHMHNISARHTFCPIHGEMIDADTDEGDSVHQHEHSILIVGQSIINGTSKETKHRHEHCSLATNRPTLITRSSSYQVIEILRQTEAQFIVRTIIRQFALILLSPKTSPPQFSIV